MKVELRRAQLRIARRLTRESLCKQILYEADDDGLQIQIKFKQAAGKENSGINEQEAGEVGARGSFYRRRLLMLGICIARIIEENPNEEYVLGSVNIKKTGEEDVIDRKIEPTVRHDGDCPIRSSDLASAYQEES